MNSIVEKKKYTHLNHKERWIIAELRYQKKSIRFIATRLARNPSTISRELRRNGNIRVYHDDHAHNRSKTRWRTSHQKQTIPSAFLRTYVTTKLTEGYSPEQITGRLSLEYSPYKTNYESIYQYIYKEAPHLVQYLRRGHFPIRTTREHGYLTTANAFRVAPNHRR